MRGNENPVHFHISTTKQIKSLYDIRLDLEIATVATFNTHNAEKLNSLILHGISLQSTKMCAKQSNSCSV